MRMIATRSIHVPQLPVSVGDLGDKSLQSHDRYVEASIASVKAELSRQGKEEAYLASVRATGVPAVCADCGDQISETRLKARPGAVRCTRCQCECES